MTLRLLSVPQTEEETWDAREFGAILDHFLGSSINEVVASTSPHDYELFKRQWHDVPAQARFCDMLESPPVPSVRLLRAAKEAAKICMHVRESGVPIPVLKVLYYTAIMSCFAHHQLWMTKLMPSEICEGLQSIMQADWLNERVRALLSQGLEKLVPTKD